jgi:hypothetical protein
MTHKSPYAWPPRPARVPPRAALIGSLPLRVQVRRALKLAGIASIWVTGLFVVIAAVAAVAMTTTPATGAHARSEQAGYAGNSSPVVPGHGTGSTAHRGAGHRGAGRHGQPGSQHSGARARGGQKPAAPAIVRDVYSGRGSAYTTAFTVSMAGLWKVSWSFSCAGSRGQSGFAVSQVDQAGHAVPVSVAMAVTRAGRSGRGVTWAHRDPGAHALEIRTPCSWQITVTTRR